MRLWLMKKKLKKNSKRTQKEHLRILDQKRKLHYRIAQFGFPSHLELTDGKDDYFHTKFAILRTLYQSGIFAKTAPIEVVYSHLGGNLNVTFVDEDHPGIPDTNYHLAGNLNITFVAD